MSALRRGRVLPWLAASALFHGACVALLPRVAPPPIERGQAVRITAVFVSPEPAHKRMPAVDDARVPPAITSPRRPSEPRNAPGTPTLEDSEREAAPTPRMTAPRNVVHDRAERDAAAMPSARSPSPLAPRDSEHTETGRGHASGARDSPDAPRAVALLPNSLGDTPVPSEDGGAADGSSGAQALVESLTRETLGRGRVDRGIVHPYFGDLGRALVARWSPERGVAEKGLPGFAAQLRRNVGAYAALWQQQAETYGQTGSPYGREQNLDPDSIPLVGNGDMQELALQRRMNKKLREKSRESRRALVRVVQDRTGKLVSVTLLRPSRDAAMDRTALEDVRAAAQLLPVPPAEALAGREKLVSTWEFEMIVSISPPVPTVSFEFDLVLKHFDARLPLDRRIYKRVRLVSTE